MDLADVIKQARAWAEADPDPAARAEIEGLLAAPDPSKTDLADRFAGSLEFGTAGLRGVIGAGPNRMNRAVVLRTTWGLARHLLDAAGPGAADKGVAIGYDGRRMSKELAEDTACVLAAAGVKAMLFDDVVPTPALAFAVTRLGCAAGVMITASHNPPEYNGYKAYWGNGAQIVPPTDTGIARAIESAPPAKDVPRLALAEATSKGLVVTLGQDLESAYLAEVKKLGARADGDRTISIVYTPMHGVGDKLCRLAFEQAGFTNVVSVPEQQKPDGAFPTVEFPNPEEKGAMDLAFALATARKADLVIANDPDADRLAVALPSDTSPTGWVQLTGNQVGALLGHYLLTGGLSSLERATKPKVGDPLVIASIVSSPMLGVIAHALGAQYDEVLTGFKWIANRALERKKKSGEHFVFGFEEALGYTVGELVRDKDGVSAAVLFAELTAVLRASGTTVLAHLEGLYRRYGLFVSSQVNLTRKGAAGLAELRAIMQRLRDDPPWTIGDHAVAGVRDFLRQETTLADGTKRPLDLPKSDVLAFELASGSRVIARPSGTEPKAKFYFDVRERIRSGEPLADAEARAAATMKALADAFVALAT
ncbi:MAG: phospho-sugar mutase [Labilithrix sp.]|nr:phospho-sugar mutase [Labilithrix sp.]